MLDLTKVLKNAIGDIFYSPIFNYSKLIGIDTSLDAPIIMQSESGAFVQYRLYADGSYYKYDGAPCILYPSAEETNWDNYKKVYSFPNSIKAVKSILKQAYKGTYYDLLEEKLNSFRLLISARDACYAALDFDSKRDKTGNLGEEKQFVYIELINGKPVIDSSTNSSKKFLVFPDWKSAEKFIINFEQLIIDCADFL